MCTTVAYEKWVSISIFSCYLEKYEIQDCIAQIFNIAHQSAPDLLKLFSLNLIDIFASH